MEILKIIIIFLMLLEMWRIRNEVEQIKASIIWNDIQADKRRDNNG